MVDPYDETSDYLLIICDPFYNTHLPHFRFMKAITGCLHNHCILSLAGIIKIMAMAPFLVLWPLASAFLF